MFEPRPLEHFSIESSWLRKSQELRLDASFYNPRVAHAIETLKKSGLTIKSLGEVTKRIFIPPRFKRIYVDREHGLPFLQGSHIVHFQPADVKFLSRSVHKNLEELTINAGWLLVTRSGTVGRVAIAPDDWDGWVASEHILRIIPDAAACPTGYLYAFLCSPIGHAQLTAQIYGAVVDELTEEQTRSVLVPLPNTAEQRQYVNTINTLALRATKLRAEASGLATKAVASIGLILPEEEPIVEERPQVVEVEQLAVNAPGPKAERLKIKGNREVAVTKSFEKRRPPAGWPK